MPRLSRQVTGALFPGEALADDGWTDIPMAISGALGPTEAQSLVRQTILAELGGDVLHGHNKASMASKASSKQQAWMEEGKTASTTAYAKMDTASFLVAALAATESAEDNWATYTNTPGKGRSPVLQRSGEEASSSPDPSETGGDSEAEAQMLRDCRLDQLRSAILGALDSPLDIEEI